VKHFTRSEDGCRDPYWYLQWVLELERGISPTHKTEFLEKLFTPEELIEKLKKVKI